MNPSQTRATTAVLRIFFASSITVFSASLPVFSARTTSSSFITLAGLEKCMPSTTCGLNAAAHRSRADHCNARYRPRRRVVGDVGNFCGGALGEECMTKRARFRRLHQLQEQRALVAQSVVERLQHCGLDGVDAFERRRK